MAFELSSISKGRRLRAPKIVIYGPPKIGKTTFATMAPASIGILTEEGVDNIDCSVFPLCTTFGDVMGAITTLFQQPHEYQTVFVDSLDWLEPLIHAQVCAQEKVANIEAIGYGKGYILCDGLWRQFLDGLDALRNTKQMTVICIAHEKVAKVKNPALQDDYDAYSLKLHTRAVKMLEEWADVIGFAGHDVMTRAVDKGFNQKEAKAVATGKRTLHLNPNPAYVAGNRYNLPDVPLGWPAFHQALMTAMAPAPAAAAPQ